MSLTAFFMYICSEMVLSILPLFLANVLGVTTVIIGVIEGLADATASLLQIASGPLSDRFKTRKGPAVLGYSITALAKPVFLFAAAWPAVACARWADRVGKGIRTAPRDALVADSIGTKERGMAFGFHRAADTGGAVLGLLIALLIVWRLQRSAIDLTRRTFQIIVLASLVPALLAVLSLVLGARDVPAGVQRRVPVRFRDLGVSFLTFVAIVGVFTLGSSSDAVLNLGAQERGLSVLHVLGMLVAFNLVYSMVSAPAGSLSDRVGRRRLLVGGWLAYASFALAGRAWQVRALYALYNLCCGLAHGWAKAMVADLVPAELCGTAYGTCNACIVLLAFPASLLAGLLWQGSGSWPGFGPSAPFLFGAAMAMAATLLMMAWTPKKPGNG